MLFSSQTRFNKELYEISAVYTKLCDFAASRIFRICLYHAIISSTTVTTIIYVLPGAHEPPEGRQGSSNYVQRHLILSGSDTFLIWTYPQVGNLPLWLLHARTRETSATYCVSTRTERVLLFRARDANSRIVNITRGPSIDTIQGLSPRTSAQRRTHAR